jgi:streptomycin 6-kinase
VGDLAIPQRLAETAVAWEGDRGRAWLTRLPSLVAEVAEAWDLELDRPYEPGGNVSWVAPCRRRTDGAELVLKVQLPHPESEPEAVALAAWGGRGAVRLEARDAERRALLLERCEPGTAIDELDGGLAVGALLHEAPVPEAGVPELVDVLRVWAAGVEDRRPLAPQLDPGLVDLAVETMRSADEAPRRVLLHGDLNPTNVLRSQRGWLAIDPKPMAGDPAFDGARLVLQLDPDPARDPAEVFAERIRATSDALDAEADRVARWCVADLVQQTLWLLQVDDRATAAHRLAVLPHITPSLP